MNGDFRDNDRGLIARIESHDADALALLYDRHSARLLGLAQRILGDTGEAEEILQEVFLRVWKAAATFDASRGPVLAWLLVATRSRSIDRLRSRRPGRSARDRVAGGHRGGHGRAGMGCEMPRGNRAVA